MRMIRHQQDEKNEKSSALHSGMHTGHCFDYYETKAYRPNLPISFKWLHQYIFQDHFLFLLSGKNLSLILITQNWLFIHFTLKKEKKCSKKSCSKHSKQDTKHVDWLTAGSSFIFQHHLMLTVWLSVYAVYSFFFFCDDVYTVKWIHMGGFQCVCAFVNS